MYCRSRFCSYLPIFLALFTIVLGAHIALAQEKARTAVLIGYSPLSRFRSTSNSQSPIIWAKISGRSYRFLLDTGAGISLLKQSVGQESRLSVTPVPAIEEDKSLSALIATQGTVQALQVPMLELGGMPTADASFYLAPDSVLSVLTNGDASFGGIIGTDYLKDAAMYLDPEKKEITLFLKGNLTSEECAKIGFAGEAVTTAALEMSRSERNQFLVEARCNDKPVRLFLDTGAEHTYIHKPMSHFAILPTDAKEFRTKSVYGESRSFAAPATLSLGKTSVTDMSVYFEDGDNIEGDGLLGMDFLSKHYVLMDFPARKIYLRARNGK